MINTKHLIVVIGLSERNHMSGYKIRQLHHKSLICQSWVWSQNKLDDIKSCYQLIITIIISHKKQIQLFEKTSTVETMSKIRSFSKFLKILQFCGVNDCCYVYCNQFCNWWIYAGELNMIGCFNYPITGVWLQPTVRWHCLITTSQNN